MCFLLADDLRWKCLFVHTSPLATILFVSLRRPFNSRGSGIIIKYATNMPSHKSSMTVACCSASSIVFQAQMLCYWDDLVLPTTRGHCYWNPLDISLCLFSYNFLLGGHKNLIMHLWRGNPQKEPSLQWKKSHTELAFWNNQLWVLCLLKQNKNNSPKLRVWNESSYKTSQNTTALERTVLGLWAGIKLKLSWFPAWPSKNKEHSQRTNLNLLFLFALLLPR